jgi:hypothetical protein
MHRSKFADLRGEARRRLGMAQRHDEVGTNFLPQLFELDSDYIGCLNSSRPEL